MTHLSLNAAKTAPQLTTVDRPWLCLLALKILHTSASPTLLSSHVGSGLGRMLIFFLLDSEIQDLFLKQEKAAPGQATLLLFMSSGQATFGGQYNLQYSEFVVFFLCNVSKVPEIQVSVFFPCSAVVLEEGLPLPSDSELKGLASFSGAVLWNDAGLPRLWGYS